MKTVIRTPTFLSTAASAGLDEEQQLEMVAAIASDPNRGDLVVGTGGCRKLRHAGHGKGKSGGYRTIHYNGADDVPVLLMVVINKRERSNLSASEKSELKQLLQRYEEEYRKGTRSAERRLRGRRLTDR